MSADNDQEVRDRLGAALGSITPRSAPFDAAMRQGHGITVRRRVSVAAGLAAAAAIVVAVPAWLNSRTALPVLAKPPVVTVIPPGHGSPAGLIASGTVGGRPWSASVGKPARGVQCFQAGGQNNCQPVKEPKPSRADPAFINQMTGLNNRIQIGIGPVAPAVTLVRIQLADGQVLDLRPVLRYGVRYIAYGIGAGQAVSSATAYAGQHELAYAVPLNRPDGPIFNDWLRPGQTGYQRSTYLIGSARVHGHAWSLREYVGPWGVCYVGSAGSACATGQPLKYPGHYVIQGNTSGGVNPTTSTFHLDDIASAVARVRLTLSDGTVINPPLTRGAGGQKYLLFIIGHGVKVTGWAAFGASGQPIASGQGNPGI